MSQSDRPDQYEHYLSRSWCRFGYEEHVAKWVQHARPFANKALKDAKNSPWIRCKGTWFVGVNALPNDENATIGTTPLAGQALDFLNTTQGHEPITWDKAQISVCYPGYPQPNENESEAAFQFRLKRDAAHVDGLLPEGAHRRRYLREPHRFVLGIPMTPTNQAHAPPVVWEGSHHIVREYLAPCYRGVPPEQWPQVDITDAYHQARKAVFARCHRIILIAQPGETFILHRLSVHGIAPWTDTIDNGHETEAFRMICYFRPHFESPTSWLTSTVN